MWNRNSLSALLGLEYPILQGPFGGGFSTAALASSVSNNGGLGSFGAHNLGPEAIRAKVAELRSLTDKPFGINLWVSDADPETAELTEARYLETASNYRAELAQMKLDTPAFPKKFGERFEEQVEALIEARPPVFSFVFGIPSASILDRCRKAGIKTVGAATTLEEALANESAGVDALVVTGLEAGGHRPSFLRPSEESLVGMSALLAVVAEKVKIPLIAAGGIVTPKQVLAAKTLGAQGFQLGTAFLACEESGASPLHRDILRSGKDIRTVLSRQYSGRLARFIENEFLTRTRQNKTPFLPYPAQNHLLGEFKKATAREGRLDLTPLYAGQSAPLVRHRTVKALMDSLIAELNASAD